MYKEIPLPFTKIHDIAKRFIKEKFPQEVPFFDHFWKVFESYGEEWATRSPDNWPVKQAVQKLPAELGFADDRAMDLVTPRFLAMLFATVFDVASESPIGETWQVVKALERYATRFRVPDDVVKCAEPMIRMLLIHDYEKVGVFPSGVLMETIAILRWDREPLEGYEEELRSELEQVRNDKLTFDIYLDDLRNEFFVKGKQKNLTFGPKKLLVLLLRKVGAYWDYSRLCWNLWHDEYKKPAQLYNLMNRLHKATKNILADFVELPRAQKRCYVKQELKEKVKYCAIFLPGDYRREILGSTKLNL